MDVNKDGILDIVWAETSMNLNLSFQGWTLILVVCYLEIKTEPIHGPYSKSGFFMKGEVKHLRSIKDKNNSVSIIAVINDNS
jgi:hypothetical protein